MSSKSAGVHGDGEPAGRQHRRFDPPGPASPESWQRRQRMWLRHRDEDEHLADVLLEEGGVVGRPAGSGRVGARCGHGRLDAGKRHPHQCADVGAAHLGPDPDHRRRGDRAVLHRDRAVRWLQQRPQRRDDLRGAAEGFLHPLQVLGDRRVAGGLVLGGQHRLDLRDRHLQQPEPADQLGLLHLRDAVAPVPGRIDLGRGQQADVVVVPQRLRGQVRQAGELTDRDQCLHAGSVHLPVTGRSSAARHEREISRSAARRRRSSAPARRRRRTRRGRRRR